MKLKTILLLPILLLLTTPFAMAQNPLDFGSDIFTADPSAHVWKDGRIYIYASHDIACQEDFWMKDWHVFSSADLIHWKDHGACMSVDDLSWADNYAWAPDCGYKNGKYYFCFPVGTGVKDRVNPKNSTKWMGIGIAVSDSPTGPFKDAIGGPLWRVPYANDPCLFIDDDGAGYVYFNGGGKYYVAKLKDDLLSVKGDLVAMDMGGYYPPREGPWVFKRKNKYYYTMPEHNRTLTYYMSDSPTGPWVYKGTIMEEENGSNNHHSIVEFKGQWILFYHRWVDTGDLCPNRKRQRKICAEYLYFNEDGTIQPVKRTKEGLAAKPIK